MRLRLLVTFYICIASFEAFSQNLFSLYPDKIEQIQLKLSLDKTDEIPYSREFICHQFAKRLFLQESLLAGPMEDYNIAQIEEQWNTTIKRSKNPTLKINYISLSSKKDGFYHAINAVLLDESAPEKIESYIFIEPQSDTLILAKDLRGKYKIQDELEVRIGTFDAYKFNGHIWQSLSGTDYTHTITPRFDLEMQSAHESEEINSENRMETKKAFESQDNQSNSKKSKVVYY